MGSPNNEKNRLMEEGRVSVSLTRGFWLGKFEVTQAEYKQLMGKNPAYFALTGSGKGIVAGQATSSFPVEGVSWKDAVKFCVVLTTKDRLSGKLPAGWAYRLPTEAQWEYACRAGTTTPTAFGDSLSSQQANFDGVSPYNGAVKGPYLARTTVVGSYRPNAWGLCDMHGNVWEWCRDWYTKKLPGGSDPEVTTKAAYPFYRIHRHFRRISDDKVATSL